MVHGTAQLEYAKVMGDDHDVRHDVRTVGNVSLNSNSRQKFSSSFLGHIGHYGSRGRQWRFPL